MEAIVETLHKMVFPPNHSVHYLCKLQTVFLGLFFALPMLNMLRLF